MTTPMPLLLKAAPANSSSSPRPAAGAPKPRKGDPASLKHGDRVRFRHGEVEGRGVIVASGVDGATVRDDEGREHHVRHENLICPGKDGDDAKGGDDDAKGGEAKKPGGALRKADGGPLLLFAKAQPMQQQPSRPWPLIPPPDAGKGGALAKADADATPAAEPPETGPEAGTVTGRALYFWRAMHAVRNLVPARRKG